MGSKYYGVIGNRDHIKIKGEKRPFWEFLDKQPDGYLTSLVYMREDLPRDMHMIFDCGAWSYRNDETPKITPESAFDGYMKLAKPGDFLIAPDHMLIPGANVVSRRKFNLKSAQQFLKLCPDEFTPMATLHGMDLNERVEHGHKLASMGYRHIAIGGVAARASQKTLVLSMILEIKKALPGVWLHVLGLSSPSYTAAWNEYGINSFDGSSHFKQAFTGGAFFTVENGKLKKHQAARPGEEITAPSCWCNACETLWVEGKVDTRQYGSNEHNMGRAAHNMNMLMRAQAYAVNGETILISCVGEKLNYRAAAKDLYQSTWFKKARKYAEENGTRWAILSAKHGLLMPDQVIDPYEQTLNKMCVADREQWAKKTTEQIKKKIPKGIVKIFAGINYREFLEVPLVEAGYFLEIPLLGMGIGQQLAWFNGQNSEQMELFNE